MATEPPAETRIRAPSAAGGASPYLLVVEGGSSFLVPLPAERPLIVGRDDSADVRLHNDAASRRHVRIFPIEGRVTVEDLGSRNGTQLNGERITLPRELSSGDTVAVGDALLVFHAAPRPAAGPTLLDAEGVRKRLEQEVERATRYERPVALLALTVTPAGRMDAQGAAAHLRPIDIAGVAGGEQFLVVMPEVRPAEAEAVAARLAAKLARPGGQVRGGLATCPADGCDAETLLAAARAAAASAPSGAIVTAAAAATRLELGERFVLIADPAMVRLYELIRRLAASSLPVLISGETGAGKENAAFAIHHWSARSQQPFVAINCAALPETLAESELFGHEKGAFSGAVATKPGRLESADGGTVFLDEVGELPLPVQAKLLRALDDKRITRLGALRDRPIDVRIVAATNRKLHDEVRTGGFRQDLFFRLGAATVVLPPLRDRPREIALLARSFLAAACARDGRPEPELSAAAVRALAVYGWPGNVRELKNAMDYVAATVLDEVVESWHLPERMDGEPGAGEPAAPVAPVAPVAATNGGSASPRPAFRPIAEELRALEQRRMEEALSAAAGNQTRAATLLSMPLRTFVLKLKQYGIAPRPR